MDKKMKYLKPYNESITNYLKPRSEDEILKLFKSDEELYVKSIELRNKYFLDKLKDNIFFIKIDFTTYQKLFKHSFNDRFSKLEKNMLRDLLLKSNNHLKSSDNGDENKNLTCSSIIHYENEFKVVIDNLITVHNYDINYYMVSDTNNYNTCSNQKTDNYYICNNFTALYKYIKDIKLKPLNIKFLK